MMISVLKIITGIIAVCGLSLAQCSILRKKREYRSRVFLCLPVSLVFSIVAIIVLFNFFDFINISGNWPEFLKDTSIEIANLGIMTVFIAIKLPLCLTLINKWKNQDAIQLTAGYFYYYDDKLGIWFLDDKWVIFRKLMKAISIGFSVACGLYLGLTWNLGTDSLLWSITFPATGLVLINEFYYFINGLTKDEYYHNVFGENAPSWRISSFFKLRDIYKKILPHAILASHIGYEFERADSPISYIKSLKASDDYLDNISYEYFFINDRYKKMDVDTIQATVKLMHNKNVVMFNPFYQDLSDYLTLPIVTTLMKGKKILVITGRSATTDDIASWVKSLLKKYTHIESLWNVGILDENNDKFDVGILSSSKLYNGYTIKNNIDFIHEVGFVVLCEPSIIINTAQVALSYIAKEMENEDSSNPTYCILDRRVNGLVDTLSHVLHTSIIDVVSSPVTRCIYAGMTWDADSDYLRQRLFKKQTKYLGNGIELSGIALRNQIPHVSWVADTKVPLKDIKWLSGQNYGAICNYINIPAQQKNLYDKIDFNTNIWSLSKSKESFIIAEDEFCNMFTTLSLYLSRGINQSFVNILSENYLLRDYFRCNKEMFLTNPDVVPNIISEYSKTERNTLIKLLLMMTFREVPEDEIREEFRLVGIEVDDVLQQLVKSLDRYTDADETIFCISTNDIEIDELSTIKNCSYKVNREVYNKFFSDSLKNAYYIVENEEFEKEYIDSVLYNHLTQKLLPRQHVVYNGKLYYVKSISPETGCILRRAADLFDNRLYYKQVRKYNILDKLHNIKTYSVMDIEVSLNICNFEVETSGFLELQNNSDLRTARKIEFKSDNETIYNRKYKNKNILKIKLPEIDKTSCFTICFLFNEIFKSVFPDAWHYLAVLTKKPDNLEGMISYVNYDLSGEVEDDCIYIIEDSELDLGLLGAIENNLLRFFEIMSDYLQWHFEKMREPAKNEPELQPIKMPNIDDKKVKRQSRFSKLADKLLDLFGRDKKDSNITKSEDDNKVDNPSESNTENTIEDIENSNESIDKESLLHATIKRYIKAVNLDIDLGNEEMSKYIPGLPHDEQIVEHTDGDSLVGDVDSVDDLDLLMPVKSSRYQRECYLKLGFDEIDRTLAIENVRSYLFSRGFGNNSLTKARKRDEFDDKIYLTENANTCDFCGTPLSGISHEMLIDGRIRCNECSSTAINNLADFKDLLNNVESMMAMMYNATFHVPIDIATVDARTIAKLSSKALFIPSKSYTARVLGFARKVKKNKFELYMENGSPRLCTIETLSHELTHIWQFVNWKDDDIQKVYDMGDPKKNKIAFLLVYEGMATWAATQLLYSMGEKYFARRQEYQLLNRADEYGIGFTLYRDRYGIIRDPEIAPFNPFTKFPPSPPLDPEFVKAAVEAICSNMKEEED